MGSGPDPSRCLFSGSFGTRRRCELLSPGSKNCILALPERRYSGKMGRDPAIVQSIAAIELFSGCGAQSHIRTVQSQWLENRIGRSGKIEAGEQSLLLFIIG